MDETIVTSLDQLNLDGDTEPYLIVIAGTNIGKLYNLKADELVAGRSQDSDIWIEDNTISRKHFKIKREGKEYTIQDLNSTNGTYVNSRRVTTSGLKAGDKIQISNDTIMQFDFFDENRRISEQKRYEMGVKDPVTGSFNKSYFLQRISDEFSFSQRQNLPLTVLMLDIDFFKVINDTHGHLAGDQVLQEISHAVAGMIRNEDVFCRYGGEEFVIIMRNTPGAPATQLAERIRKKVEDTVINYEGTPISVTISLGLATSLGRNFRDYVALIAEADKYLYKSKGNGRNRVSSLESQS